MQLTYSFSAIENFFGSFDRAAVTLTNLIPLGLP